MKTLTASVALAAALLLGAAPRDVGAQDTATVVSTTRPTAPPAAAAIPSRGKPSETVVGSGPNGAKMRCRDGSYPAAAAPDNACATKGGILVRFPLQRMPVNAPSANATGPRPLSTDAAPAADLRADPTPDRSRVVVPAERPPVGATLQCGDGTFIVSDTTSARCTGKGGVQLIFPPPRRP